MKFCYLDESATADNCLIVMAGIVVDAYRMHKTKELWADFLAYLSKECNSSIKEFHTKEFIAGTGVWRNITGAERARLIAAALKWISTRSHRITFSSVLRGQFEKCREKGSLESPWHAAALHCVLTIQKCFQSEIKNKGNTVFIFDKGRDEKALSGLCDQPPNWTDEYYDRAKKQAQLDQMIDVPLFADSEKALLIQVADLVAYVLRRRWEIESGTVPPKYQEEKKRVDSWFDAVKTVSLPRRCRYPARSRTHAQQVFWDLCPEVFRT